MSGQTMTSAVVWAGSDLYSLVHIPADLQGNRPAMYAEVVKKILPTLINDFGEGVELVEDIGLPGSYAINVDGVKYTREVVNV